MGSWGITAFESDTGLDTMIILHDHLPTDGHWDLAGLIEVLKESKDISLSDPKEGHPVTSPMALAEMLMGYLDGQARDMGWAYQERPEPNFDSVRTFTMDKPSLQWLRTHLDDTLRCARRNAAMEGNFGGWFMEQDWIDCQKHMQGLVDRLDRLIQRPESTFDLLAPEVIAENRAQPKKAPFYHEQER